MSHTVSVRKALRARLLTAPGLPAKNQWQGKAFEAVVGVPYVRETLKPFASKRRSLGPQPRIRESGLYLIDIFWPAGSGTSGADTLADAIVIHFGPGVQLIRDGYTVSILSSSQAGDLQETDWRMVPVTVSYFSDRLNP